MEFNPGFDITIDEDNMRFIYGSETFGPEVEQRHLDDIRQSLSNPNAQGPPIPYAIAMDIGKKKHLEDLKKRHLLYGAVIYAKGQIGEEPVRSQGHSHALSPSCQASTPEVYEIWDGEAIIFMQEAAKDDPGKCYAIYAKAGEVVIVPPSWAHYAVNANTERSMAFGAWCIRDYRFDYDSVRAHGGLAYFPVVDQKRIKWVPNKTYQAKGIICKKAREYKEFDLTPGVPVYIQYESNPELFAFVTNPDSADRIWESFEP